MQHPVNPDSRPLPPGWAQHHDSQKQTWYYICMSFQPPRVSTAHPLGPIRETSSRVQADEIRSVSSQPESASMNSSSSMHPSPSTLSQPSGLSFAQQLYASAGKAASNSSLPSSSLERPATYPSHASLTSIPTPPNSPPLNTAARRLAVLPAPLPPNANPSTGHSSFDASELYGTPLIPHSRRGRKHDPSSPGRHPSSHGTATTHGYPSHRSQSYQLPTSSAQGSLHPHRASTFSTGISKPNETPTLVTKARPPLNLSTPQLPTTPSLPLQPNVIHSNTLVAPVPSYPTPPLPPLPPISPPAAAPNVGIYPLTPPGQTLLPPTPISPQYPQVSQIQTLTPPSTQSLNAQTTAAMKHAGKAVGKSVGKFALNLASGAMRASLGLPLSSDSVGGTIGSVLANGTVDDDAMNSLSNGLSNLVNTNSEVDASQIQAVVQGQAGADYQSIINALVQQQQALAQPTADYQALITQLQQQQAAAYTIQASNQPTILGSNVQQPAQAGAQNPTSTYQNAYSAQIQALSASEQQYQNDLQVYMAQINAAAAQEVAQAQQNTNNMLQAAYQQQQQQMQQNIQQHQQQQVQQQIQQQQQQQIQIQQQLQQMQAANSQPPPPQQNSPTATQQGPSRLDTMFTTFGNALSTVTEVANNYSDAGGGDSFNLDFSGDAYES